MKRVLLSVSLTLAGTMLVATAADSIWINSGSVTVPPQINATNVVNNGTINITTTAPFQTSSTLNYTNRGTMIGSVGWKFHNAPVGNGSTKASAVFHNHPGATVAAVDGLTPAKLVVAATNVINEGILSVDQQGVMTLTGTNVNLRRGGVQVLPLTGIGSAEDAGITNFLPDVGIIDDYWGIGSNTINTATILNQVIQGSTTNWQAVSPAHLVQTPFPYFGLFTQVFASPAAPFVWAVEGDPVNIVITNDLGQPDVFPLVTNYVVQGAFVEVSGTNFGVQARFFPSSVDSNLFNTIGIKIATTVSNSVTLQEDEMALYLLDRIAAESNFGLAINIGVNPATARPSPYFVSRIEPIEYSLGFAPNSFPVPNLFFDQTFSNRFAPARWAGYGFTADRLAQRELAIPGGTLTNVPGRIEINAGSLNLERTRFRSDGLVTVKGKHLYSSTNAVMDAWNLRFDLGSTNGQLRIQNLSKAEVNRFGGSVQMWSGVWNNTSSFVITNNYAPDPNDTNVFIPAPITNSINWSFHALVVDAGLVILPTPVTTFEFIARSTNVVLADPMTVTNKFFTDAQRFTVEGPAGRLTLTNGIPNFTVALAPNLRYFTNGGSFSVANEARFGYDASFPATGLSVFVNRSNLTAAGVFVTAAYFENGGTIDSGTLLSLSTVSGRFENGNSSSGSDLDVKAFDFKLRNATHQALGALNFVITNSLFDNGSLESNRLSCSDGFHVTYVNGSGKPTSGDLLGTTIESAAPVFASVEHTWPGNDRGATTAGFTNNLALGRLVLSLGLDAEMVFAGSGVSNALYVDYLSLQGIDLAAVETALVVNPNLVIYFADANLPAEELDGKLGGRLRWVKDFAGPYSSIELLVNGEVIRVNRALRQSVIIDSDGDGLANGYDASPFDPAVLNLAVVSGSPLKLNLKWNAAAQTVYKVEYTTNNAQSWNFLKYYTNNAATAAPASVLDQVPAGSPQRYYRVGYRP